MALGDGEAIMSAVADINVHKAKLFEMYQKCRYNELASHALMGGCMRIEKAVRISTVGAIFVSLLTGAISFLNRPVLNPIWALVTVIATILSVYSLIANTSSKQFHWFSVAAGFRSQANAVEYFSELVRLGRVAEDELLKEWQRFAHAIENLLTHAGADLPAHCSQHRDALDTELKRVLSSEGKL
jgi:hypothetical protein